MLFLSLYYDLMSWWQEDYQPFEGVGTRRGESYARISVRGSISFNAGFVEANKADILDCNFINLGYSKANNAIFVHFVTKEEKRVSIRLSKNVAYTFYARSFFNKFNINYKDLEVAGRYEIERVHMPNKGPSWAILLDKKI